MNTKYSPFARYKPDLIVSFGFDPIHKYERVALVYNRKGRDISFLPMPDNGFVILHIGIDAYTQELGQDLTITEFDPAEANIIYDAELHDPYRRLVRTLSKLWSKVRDT